MDIVGEFAYFTVPLFVAGIVHHFVVIPRNRFSLLARPIDGGMMVGGMPFVGRSKTWRGFAVMVVVTSTATALVGFFIDAPVRLPHWASGALVGLGYCVAELPNSFFKRRLGWAEGTNGRGVPGVISRAIDQLDSIVGAIIAMLFVYPATPRLAILLCIFGTGVHFVIDTVLRRKGYKRPH